MPALDFLFVMDPLPLVQPTLDTTYDLMVAAERRGHRVHWCEQHQLGVKSGTVTAYAQQVSLTPNSAAHYTAGPWRELVLTEIAGTFMRKDPPVDAAYMNAALILRVAYKQGAKVYNRPDSLVASNEKLYALNFPALVPETIVTTQMSVVRQFIAAHAQIVLKPLDGNGGRGVFMVKKGDSNLGPVVEMLTNNGRLHLLAQRYLPEVVQGDKRIIMVDGEVKGAINRVPMSGDHRANMHVGGKAVPTELNAREMAVCEALAPSLKGDGHLFVGIDVIGGFLTEVNVTSPTGVQEVRRLSGVDISPMVVAAMEQNAA